MADSTPEGRRLLVAAGIVWLGQRLLLQRRSPQAEHGAGQLEFPGGKIEPGESPAKALARELIEEWGSVAEGLRVGQVAEVLHHDYPPPGPEVVLVLYHVDAAAWIGTDALDQVVTEAGAELVECEVAALDGADFLAADRALVQRLRDGRLRP